jgi:hypothetical protein
LIPRCEKRVAGQRRRCVISSKLLDERPVLKLGERHDS